MPEPFGPMMAWTSPSFTVEVEAVEDLAVVDLDVQVPDVEQAHVSYFLHRPVIDQCRAAPCAASVRPVVGCFGSAACRG